MNSNPPFTNWRETNSDCSIFKWVGDWRLPERQNANKTTNWGEAKDSVVRRRKIAIAKHFHNRIQILPMEEWKNSWLVEMLMMSLCFMSLFSKSFTFAVNIPTTYARMQIANHDYYHEWNCIWNAITCYYLLIHNVSITTKVKWHFKENQMKKITRQWSSVQLCKTLWFKHKLQLILLHFYIKRLCGVERKKETDELTRNAEIRLHRRGWEKSSASEDIP